MTSSSLAARAGAGVRNGVATRGRTGTVAAAPAEDCCFFLFEIRRFSGVTLRVGLTAAFAPTSGVRSGLDARLSASDVRSITATSVLAVEPRSIVAATAKVEKNRTSRTAIAKRTRS